MHNNVSRAIALPLFPFHNIIHHHFNASTFSHTHTMKDKAFIVYNVKYQRRMCVTQENVDKFSNINFLLDILSDLQVVLKEYFALLCRQKNVVCP